MKALVPFLLVVGLSSSALAGPQSTVGAKPLKSDTVHNTGVGWPSLFYEWWHSGRTDWAIGAELVYGDWVGAYSDVGIGGGFNAQLRWNVRHKSRAKATSDVALRFSPGLLLANSEGPADLFIFGLRGEFAVPVSIDLHDRVSLVTGGNVPFSLFFVEGTQDPYGVIPILFRLGVEINAGPKAAPFFLVELGPAIPFGDVRGDVDFAFRIWVGTAFWSVLN